MIIPEGGVHILPVQNSTLSEMKTLWNKIKRNEKWTHVHVNSSENKVYVCMYVCMYVFRYHVYMISE